MITRIWHGKTKKEHAETYRQYVIETGICEYIKTEGNLDTQIWQRDEGDVTHIWTVTQWQNLEAVKSFAGNDIEKAKYYPEDENYLLELEPEVIHANTLSFSKSRMKNYIRQFKQLYEGGSWNDESYMQKLKDINGQKAFVQPAPDKHSVAEILWHVIYWRTVLIKRIEGDNEFREKTFNEQNFLPLKILLQKGWNNLLDEFKQSQELLISVLDNKEDSFLQEEFTPGNNFDYIVEGLIHHDIYHLGQIGLVISLLNNKKNKKTDGFADLHQTMFII